MPLQAARQDAKVIDLQAYRRERVRQISTTADSPAPYAQFTWAPVWFVPVFFVGLPAPSI